MCGLSDSARDRLSRMQALARMAPGHAESALAVARAALDAREFATARDALEHLLAASRRSASRMLMAELEQLEGDEGRAREWMARALNAARDPAWTADGFVSDRWLPVSPVTGRLDAFQWKVPVAELDAREPVMIEAPVERAPPELSPRSCPAGASARGSLAAARQRDARDGDRAAVPRRARVPARRADHSARRRSRTTPAPSRRRIPMRSCAEPKPGRLATDSSAFPVKLARSGNGPAGFMRSRAYVFRACGRPTSPCGLPRGRLSGARPSRSVPR